MMHLAVLLVSADPTALRALFRSARQAGFDAVQIWANYQADDEEWRDLSSDLDRLGLRLIAGGGYANPLNPNLEERATSIGNLRAVIERAPSLGYETVVTWSGTRNEAMFSDHPDNGSAAVWAEAVAHFREVACWAEAAGVTVAVEPFHNHVASTPERLRDLLAAVDSPRLGAVMDPPNFQKVDAIEAVNARMPAVFETLRGRIALVHAKDIRRPAADDTRHALDGVALPHPGGGIMDYALYARLIRQNYDGPVVVEHINAETMGPARAYVARHMEATDG